ncbi:MAG: PLxRFG domain-containing protein, partial [Silanimonas sp.]
MRVVFERDSAVPVSDGEVAPARGSVIQMGENGGDATVYIEHGEQRRIVLDASKLKAGEAKGSALYMALFNFALNTDRVFIGDPSGLSDEALLRRTELMAAAAIKHQTTRMMKPHPRQVSPDVKWATPLPWTPGDDGANMEALLRTSYQNTLFFAPEIADGSFDFAVQDFRGAGGQPLTRDGLERIAGRARKAFAGRPRQRGTDAAGEAAFGRTTIARALLAHSLVRRAGEAGPVVVDGVERGAGRGTGGVAPTALQRILYSQPGPDAAKPGEPLFSQPDPKAVDDAIGEARKERPLTDSIRQAFDDATKGGGIEAKARQALLYGVTLRHIADLGGKLLPSLKPYVDTVQQMATDRNAMQEDAGAISGRWEKLQRKDRRGADDTANLMHDATIDGVDPDAEYQPLTFATFETVNEDGKATERRVERDLNRRNVEAEVQAIRRRTRDADDATKAKAKERITQLEERLAQEQARAAAYPVLLARWQALPEPWKQLYRDARDAYSAQSARYEEALVKRIEDLVEEGATRASYVAQIRQQFESQRLEGPYFPLARFGDFWISAKAPDGTPAFFMYEKIGEWRRAQADLKSRGYTIRAASEKFETVNASSGPSSGFMADLMDTLGKAGVTDDAKDAVYQLYLRSLPDLSIRKSFIHRKKTAGYSADALRAFAGNLFHGSFQIARLRHSHNLELAMRAMRDQEAEYAKTDPDKAQQAAQIIREMTHRHEWVMNPKDSAVTNTLTSLGFIWYLGVSPAAALINLTQVAIVTFPALAAKFGATKASGALMEGMRRAIGSVTGDITKGLDDEERRAFKFWYESGFIDKTMTHNLAGLSETDSTAMNPVYRRTMEIVSFLFHKAEVVNREASALAAYRLAREGGMDASAAMQYAGEIVTETHFDYSNANRARWMQGNVA